MEDGFRQFVVSLAMLLHVELIIDDVGVSLFGKSVQGHPVAIYTRPRD